MPPLDPSQQADRIVESWSNQREVSLRVNKDGLWWGTAKQHLKNMIADALTPPTPSVGVEAAVKEVTRIVSNALDDELPFAQIYQMVTPTLTRLAAQVAAQVREECARIASHTAEKYVTTWADDKIDAITMTGVEISEAIRRGTGA